MTYLAIRAYENYRMSEEDLISTLNEQEELSRRCRHSMRIDWLTKQVLYPYIAHPFT